MLESIKNFGSKKPEEKKTITKNAPRISAGVLAPPTLGENAKDSLKAYASNTKNNINLGINSTFADEIATIYSEGDTGSATKKLKEYINANKWNAEQKLWYMLLDLYQIAGTEQDFEKVAQAFAKGFDCSPPMWKGKSQNNQKSIMTGKNIMFLDTTLSKETTDTFKEFLLASKEEKFCRINVSQCKFEQSDIDSLKLLYKLFKDLKKNKVQVVLMGDNNLISFCKNYINPNEQNKNLNQTYIENEELFWLFYLEILQWKGYHEEFEDFAMEYTIKFEISPPGWENSAIMISNNSSQENTEDDEKDVFIGEHNVDDFIDSINELLKENEIVEIDISHLERINFAAASSINHFLQEKKLSDDFENKKIIFKNPNELIHTLLDMVGISEIIEIQVIKR